MKLSVIIATRNRQNTASKVIKEILGLGLPEVELVVSDTSKIPLSSFLPNDITNNKQFIYKHSNADLSMDENYSIGIDLAKGKYIILIGDDDIILPNIISVVDYAIKHDIKCITQTLCASFIWEDNDIITINFSKNKSVAYEEMDSNSALQRILASSGYFVNKIPRLYHGIVCREILTTIKKDYNKYFFGVSPDISSSIILCFYVKKYYLSHQTFSIGGSSRTSNSNIGVNRLAPNLFESPHWAAYQDVSWPPSVPPYWNAESVWAGTAIITISHIKPDLLSSFNLVPMYSRTLLKYGGVRENTYKTMTETIRKEKQLKKINRLLLIIQITIEISKYLTKKIKVVLPSNKKTTTPFSIRKINALISGQVTS